MSAFQSLPTFGVFRIVPAMDEISSLRLPHVRRELMLYLAELAADDPRATWQEERERQGLSSGIDEVFHFFFDDHDLTRPPWVRCFSTARKSRLLSI